jgi:hypothetical protein
MKAAATGARSRWPTKARSGAARADTPVFLASDEITLATAAPGWEALFDAHQVAWALLPPDAPLAQQLAGRWPVVWTGPDRTLYRRPGK